MKKALCIVLLVCVVFLTGCDEQKTVNSIKTGATAIQAAAQGLYAAVNIAHASGQITDVRWVQFMNLWEKYQTANKLLMDGLNAWQSGVGKPTLERLQALIENLNVILADINNTIAAWKIPINK